MSRRLIVLNAALGILCVALAVGIMRALLLKLPVPVPGPVASRAAIVPDAPVPIPGGPSEASAADYAAIIKRNLFNPSRNEPVVGAPSTAKPVLQGVVIDGARSRAYLEDPLAKRVTGYSIGDEVAGGRIRTIAGDRVIVARAGGIMEILLQDPSKPREAPMAAVAPPAAGVSGQIVRRQPGAPPKRASPVPPQPRARALGQGRPGDD